MEENNSEEIKKISDLVLEHLMNPVNYGELKDAYAVGVGFDEQTGELATIYLDFDGDKIKEIKWNTNGCADTVIAGSMFSEMVNGIPIELAVKASEQLQEKIKSAPPKQQACSLLVLTAFEAALLHKEKKDNGLEVGEFEKILMENSCEAINQEEGRVES